MSEKGGKSPQVICGYKPCSKPILRMNLAVRCRCGVYYHSSCSTRSSTEQQGVFKCCNEQRARASTSSGETLGSSTQFDQTDTASVAQNNVVEAPPPPYEDVASVAFQDEAVALPLSSAAPGEASPSLVLDSVHGGNNQHHHDLPRPPLLSEETPSSAILNHINEQTDRIFTMLHNLNNNMARVVNQNEVHSRELEELRAISNIQRDCIKMLDTQVQRLTSDSKKFTDFVQHQNNLRTHDQQPTPTSIENLTREIQDRFERSLNVVVYNLQEADANTETDATRISDLLQRQGILIPNLQPRRVGRSVNGRPRAVIVSLSSRAQVLQILRNRRLLPPNLQVSEDRTRQQRELFNRLKEEVRQHNRQHPNEPCKIKFVNGTPTIVRESEETLRQKN